jgi:basic membrane protein A
MQKRSFAVMALLVILSLFVTACGGGQAPAPAAEAPKPAAEEKAAEPTATPVPAEPTATLAPTEPAPTVESKEAAKALKFGLVTDVGKIDDRSFNESSWNALTNIQKSLGAEIKYIVTVDPKDYAKNIATFADDGYTAIVISGFALGPAALEAAQKYPDVMFIGVDIDVAGLAAQANVEAPKNLAGLIFDEDKSAYLAGALAGLMTKSNVLGAVLGTDLVPPVWRFGEGYKAGAKAVNSKVEVIVVYHSDVGFDKTFDDPEWGKTTALSMVDKGADFVFGAGGKTGNGALYACAETSKCYAVGVDQDQYFSVPEAQKVLITSAMKMITPGVETMLKQVADGTFQGGNTKGDVGLAPYHDLESQVPQEVKDKLAEIAAGLKDGSIQTGVAPAKPQ